MPAPDRDAKSASEPTAALNSSTASPEPSDKRSGATSRTRPHRGAPSGAGAATAGAESHDGEDEAELEAESEAELEAELDCESEVKAEGEHEAEADAEAEHEAEAEAEHDTASEAAESQKPRQRSRASLACVACRRRKIRCDGVMPECGNCGNSSRECIYVKVRNTPAARVRSEKRLDMIEAKLEQIVESLAQQQVLHQKALAATEANLLQKLAPAAASPKRLSAQDGSPRAPAKRSHGDAQLEGARRTYMMEQAGQGHGSSPGAGSTSGTDGEADEALASVVRSGGVGVVAGDKGVFEDPYTVAQSDLFVEKQFATHILAVFFSPRALTYIKERIGDELVANRLWEELRASITRHVDGCFDMASRLATPGVMDPAFLDLCLHEYKQISSSIIWQVITPDEAIAARQHPNLYGMHALKSGHTMLIHAVAAFIANSMVLDDKIRAVSNEYILQQGEQALAWGLWCAHRSAYFESHITLCRAMLLVLFSAFRFPVPRVVYDLISALVRQASAIGLNRESFYRGRSPEDARRRRVLWWLICMCDGHYTAHYGFKPVISLTDNSVEPPPLENPGEYTDLLSGHDALKLCKIWSRIYERLYSASVEKRTRSELMESVVQCDDELREWKEGLRPVCRLDSQGRVDQNVPLDLRWCAMGILNMHLMYQELLILVHRHTLALQLPLREHVFKMRARAMGQPETGGHPPVDARDATQSVLICAESARNMLRQSVEISRRKRSVDVGMLISVLNALVTLLIKGVIRPDDQNAADAELIRATFSVIVRDRQLVISSVKFHTFSENLGAVVADVLDSTAKNRANPRQRKRRKKPPQPQPQPQPQPPAPQMPVQPQRPQSPSSQPCAQIQFMSQPNPPQHIPQPQPQPQPWQNQRGLQGAHHQMNYSSDQRMIPQYNSPPQHSSSHSHGPTAVASPTCPILPEMRDVGQMPHQMGQPIYSEATPAVTDDSHEQLDDLNEELLEDIDLQFASDMIFVPGNIYGYREPS